MNLAVGLTPAWQHILAFDEFRLDAVNRARESHWVASGKVLNVGIALHRLGGPSKTLALVGGSPLDPIEHEFDELGVPHRFVVSSTPTRVCTTILDFGGGRSSKEGSAGAGERHGPRDGRLQMTELVENARPMGEGEYERFVDAYEEEARAASIVVLTGSLPAGTPPRLYRELLERTACPAILDARGEELALALELEPFLVKPNREELEKTIGREIRSDSDLRDGMRELHRLGAQWVVVSQGGGVLWVSSREGDTWRLRPPVVEAVNPIGCGDCLAAGIAWGVSRGLDVVEAVKRGIGAAVQNLQDLLPSRVDPDTVERIARTISPERV
ncbi:MAG TPA: PfkB family carbohydrate kinase [Planctomycetota bacterium]|nr:PfkB family carbohydrate kinase [Planctomycetota bacterium]